MTRRPLTLTWPWLTSWREANGVGTNLERERRWCRGASPTGRSYSRRGIAETARGVLMSYCRNCRSVMLP